MLSRFSCVQLFATLCSIAHQAPLSMGFSRKDYWSGLPCPPPGDLPNPGIKPASLMSPALAGEFFTTSTTWETPTLGEGDTVQAITLDHTTKLAKVPSRKLPELMCCKGEKK